MSIASVKERNYTWLFYLALAAQLGGLALMWVNRSSPQKVMLYEGSAVTFAAFFIGFVRSKDATFWHWFLTAVNFVLMAASWVMFVYLKSNACP